MNVLFMPYFVYIMQSDKDLSYYKGLSEDYLRRLAQHNFGQSQYTSSKVPWRLVYVEEHERTALIREKFKVGHE